jgi:CRISPR-associated endonuclease/helicase Cas3
LWAKTDPEVERWHALPYHLVDVGSTAEILWENLPASSKKTAVKAFGNPETAKRCLTFLAAAHDIGKANRFFQAKDPRQLKRLAHLGVKPGEEARPHGLASAALLRPWLMKVWGWGQTSASGVAVAVGGHHGVFRNDLESCERLDLSLGYAPSVTLALLDELAELYGVSTKMPEPPGEDLNSLLGWLAGFVSVADWLGSHCGMTVWKTGVNDLAAYRCVATDNARLLFCDIEWAAPVASAGLRVEDLVPNGLLPNELQALAGVVAKEDFGLAILEAPTGEGKTEAAFAICEKGRSSGDGVYFALPTMATANGINDRVCTYLQKATGVEDLDVRLLHSQAWLYRSDTLTVSNPTPDESQHVAEDWFSGGKRALLTPYGVGTIDQCLVASLRAKHGFVRLFALAGKTIVVDEVHAYDVYMGDLLARLLGWLRMLSCRVILLSATLPKLRRQELIRSWGTKHAGDEASYPCITWVGADNMTHSRSFQVSQRKPVKFELVPSGSEVTWKVGADKIAALITANGGFGCFVVNTVKDAQEAFAYLSQAAGSEFELDLFHARYTMEDRAVKEQHVLGVFGKAGTRGRSRILIATQVVEQSLDLDFDHMVSILAPIDLLIQRAGRMHRHKRNAAGSLQPAGYLDERANPTLWVIQPSLDDSDLVDIKDRVYDHDVLLRTDAYLQTAFVIREPQDVSAAVDWVYDNKTPESDNANWLKLLEEVSAKAETKRIRHHDAADDAMICAVDSWNLITDDRTQLEEDDDTPGSQVAARTRLEELLSVNLVIFRSTERWPPSDFDKNAKRTYALRTVRTPVYGTCLTELAKLAKPPNWDKSGSSKFAIPIPLNEDGRFETESYRFHYDCKTGLVTEKINAKL